MNEATLELEPIPKTVVIGLSSATDWAWAAGFIDGEGCFCIAREHDKRKGPNYRGYRSAIQVTNTSKNAIDRLQKILGTGQVILQIKHGNSKPCYHFSIRNKPEIIRVTLNLLPYLVNKRTAAELMLAFSVSRQAVRSRGRYAPFTANEIRMFHSLKQVNKRGIYDN